MNGRAAVDAVSWAVLRQVTADQVLPHLLVPLEDLPEDLTGELRTLEQMSRHDGLAEVPPIGTYGIATGTPGEVGLFALGRAFPGGGRELWPVHEFPLYSDPQPGWYEQQRELGSVIITAYTDIFLAALVAEHDEQVGPAQAKRFVETSSFGVAQAFTLKDLRG